MFKVYGCLGFMMITGCRGVRGLGLSGLRAKERRALGFGI